MAAIWFVIATALATATAGAILLVAHRTAGVPFDLPHFVLILAPASQVFLLWACIRRARRVGGGNVRRGLGWLPVRRGVDVVLLTGFGVMLAIGHVALALRVPAYRAFFEQARTSIPMPDQTGLGTAAYIAWVVMVVVIGAPIGEELFFRGWLWVGLERWWSVWIVAPLTGCLWLVAHISDGGWRRLLALLPAMVLISIARAIGGSVRASMAVHMANNAALSAVLIAGKFVAG